MYKTKAPLQSEHSYDFVDQRTSSSGGGNSAAAWLQEYNPRMQPSSPRRSFGGSPEELSSRTAAELSPTDFSAPGGHPPEQPESFGGSSAPGVHRRSCRTATERLRRQQPGSSGGGLPPSSPRRSCRTATEASAAVRQLRRGELGGSPAAQLPEYNPFLLHVAVHGLQRVKAKVPFPQFFSTMAEITPTTSLYLLWKCQRLRHHLYDS
ncbi:unnamed protein product [Boreogadus saida]